MTLTNTLLWSFSLTLAIIGISFGIIASYNSHKANKAVKEMIKTSWVADESEKLFFSNLRLIILENAKVLTALRHQENITYKQYAILAHQTRLAPINQRVKDILTNTEFDQLMNHYIKTKSKLELSFSNIINNFKVLNTNDIIPKEIVKSLIEYHRKIKTSITPLIREYTKHIN